MEYLTSHLTETAFNLIKTNHTIPGVALTQDDGVVHMMPYITGVVNDDNLNPNNEVIDEPIDPDGPGSNIDEPVIDLPDDSNVEFVDLGLSVKWRNRNIGANLITDYGNYYAWGELNEKPGWNGDGEPVPYNQQNYLHKDKDWHNILPSGILLLDYDAAYQTNHLWRMPTKEECEELMLLPHKWVYKMNPNDENDVGGMIFAKTQEELNGEFNDKTMLYLPSHGRRVGTATETYYKLAALWTSTFYETYGNEAYSIRCTYDNNDAAYVIEENIVYGLNIRPVQD